MALINCNECGKEISEKAKSCPYCGNPINQTVEKIIINNNASVNNTAPSYPGKPKNKWIALLLCLFTVFGHKIYEGKIGMAVLYFFTIGLFGIGWLFDIIALLCKPTTYYV